MFESVINQTPDEPEEEVYVFPASFAQSRLWFLDQFDPGSPFYNIPMAFRVRGSLSHSILERCLNEIVRRHETLRTTFSTLDGQPVQVIHPQLRITIPAFDLRDVPESERQSHAISLANQEARKPFNLSQGPLLRTTLLRVTDQENIILFTMHHIISDGWSMSVLIYELSVLYEAYISGRQSPLPELPIQYADYSEWQRDWLQGEVLESQIRYWVDQFTGGVEVLELPTDRPRPAVVSSRGAATTALFSKDILDRLKLLSLKNDTTLFMTLLAAFQVLLYRYSSQTSFAVGSPIANRGRAELEALIGVFINTVVFRADISGELSFHNYLHKVKEITLGAYANQDVPFEVVLDRLQLVRDMSHNPLFQVMIILQNAPAMGKELPGITLEQIDVHSGTSTFDLTYSISERIDGLFISVEYNTDLFDLATIQRMLAHFKVLVEAIVRNPDQAISSIPILTSAERSMILDEWNQTKDDFSSAVWPDIDRKRLGVHQLFALQAMRRPDAIAVIAPAVAQISRDGGSSLRQRSQLTYSELFIDAKRLAVILRRYGVGPNTVVGICMERTPKMIIALLGVLFAGGAYLPLDPLAPRERLAFILDDSTSLMPGAKPIVITQSHLRDRFPEIEADWLIVNDEPDFDIYYQETDSLDKVSDIPSSVEHTLAYMTYTSGSTGQAKGVMVEHHSLMNAYLAWEQAYALSPENSHLQMANFTFDVFSGDLVRALCSGAKLVLCPREWLLSAGELYRLMLDETVDIAEFVPAVLRNLVQYLEANHLNLEFLRLLACGSDSWYVGEYRQFRQFLHPEARLINSFGLTEVTIDSTYFEDPDEGFSSEQLVPIGRPFSNTLLYILDSLGQPQPIGVPGELYIGGPGVARGYHHRDDLNIEKFVTNPFVDMTDLDVTKIMYRTGDLARYLSDGNVEFLGRLDDQIKIRGLRIEPGEIEAIYSSHPAIKEAAIVLVEMKVGIQGQDLPAGDDKRLVVYLVCKQNYQKPTSGELRRWGQEKLPDYMVPSAFVLIDSIPLNASGKVDRLALVERYMPDWSERQVGNEYLAPRTAIEELLVDLWSKLLGVQQIGIGDNFFELGGHSLLATQLISRVRDAFQVEIPLRHLFESPTITTLAEQIEITRTSPLRGAVPPITPITRDLLTGVPVGQVPLSFAQQRLWFLDQLEPDSPFYNLPEAVRITGRLDVSVFQECLNELIRRHETLRTTFQLIVDTPVQVIHALNSLEPLKISIEDIRDVSPEHREEQAMIIAEREAQTPFQLHQGPLFRVKLVLLDDLDTIVLLTMHHIIGDNWSSNVLIQEIAVLYDAFSNRRSSPLPGLSIQYADYSWWQRNWLQGEVLDEQLTYWKTDLTGLPPVLELPTDRPRPAVQTFVGDYCTFELSSLTSSKLRALCRSEGVTLFMALLAAFEVLIYRYSWQEDFAIGSPIANRNRAETENLIGFFVNTLVFRAQLSEELNFRTILRDVRNRALGAFSHQDVPFEMIVDALQPERNLSHSPLFQVMFVLQTALRSETTLPGSKLKLGPVEVHSGTAKFDLTLFLVDSSGSDIQGGKDQPIRGAFEYNTDLFNRSSIEQMMNHLAVLIDGMITNLDTPVSRLPILTATERRKILVEWNQTLAPYPTHLCAHQLFEAQVKRTPDAIALSYVHKREKLLLEEHLTYRELNQRANQLALYLQSRGIGPEVLVGLCLERSFEMVIGLMGVLKAGGAYVPLDPSYPTDRLRFMITDSNTQVILTQSHLLERLRLVDEGRELVSERFYLCLDRDWNEVIALQPKRISNDIPVDSEVGPENLAYVIYTSGSTGRPKGAMILHRGLVNYLTWCEHAYPIGQGQGSPVHSSISFDLTVTSLFTPLIVGKRAVLLAEGLSVELLGEALRQEAQRNGEPYSLVKITPAHLQLLGEQLRPDEARNRTLAFIIGGENLTVEQIGFWLENSPITELVNEYGPTETVVGCCVYRAPLDSLARFPGGVIPIGKPIINTQLYVLDNQMQPVPVGVVGELYIGGLGVGRGYLNQPELTAEKYIQNPFTGEDRAYPEGMISDSRLYRTGDLARYREDGNLDCLGRIDFQVKIRGYRVELGEIEAVISQHPDIKEAVVWTWDSQGIKNLVAYLVPKDAELLQPGGRISLVSELRGYLRDKLPEYMIPMAFELLEYMPLTANGKVDRKALPNPEITLFDEQGSRVNYFPPRTPQEEIIAGLLAQILRRENISIYDNFFELGGHSLLATQVISRLRDALHIELPLREFFGAPTIAGLAMSVERVRTEQLGLMRNPILPIARDIKTGLPLEPAALSYAQQRLWVLDQLIPGSPLYNIPIAVELHGKVDFEALTYSLNKIINRHEVMRTIFIQSSGLPAQVVLSELVIQVPITDLSDLSVDELKSRAMKFLVKEAQTPFDLSTGPLIRIHCYRLDSESFLILLNTHHIITDDWSLGIFIRELVYFYDQYVSQIETRDAEDGFQARSQQHLLPELPIQYVDFAAWQREWLRGDVLNRQIQYWKETLTGAPGLLALPTDRPRPLAQTFRGGQVTFILSLEELEEIKLLGQKSGATLFMTLLAAFKVLLFRYTGQEDIVVGTPIANRTRLELENLIGFFVNTLVLRTTLSGENTFINLLHQVRDTALGAYDNQDVPFEMLVDQLQPERDLSYHPIFQVMFLLQNAPREYIVPTDGLTIKPVEAEETIARFDLTVTFYETPAGLKGSIEYNTDLFDRSTIERMAEHYLLLVSRILKTPEQAIGTLQFLTLLEQQQLLTEWVDTAENFPGQDGVYKLFEAHAGKNPGAVAVVYDREPFSEIASGQQLTYSELNGRANLLAHYLISCGVKPDTLVGICVERSIEMVVGLLGIMKAGGAYMPMDPGYPADRLSFMLEDSKVPVLLTQASLVGRIPEKIHGADRKVICLDQDWEEISRNGQERENPQPDLNGDNLAYVIYTSGSTGRPKGVLLKHRGLANLVHQQIKGFGVDSKSCVLQFASFSFDASVSEIFMALAAGGELVLTHQDILGTPTELLAIMKKYTITTITLPPSMLRVLDPDEFDLNVPGLKTLISAGESCPREIAERWAYNRSFFNAYGPTEATIGPSYYHVKAIRRPEDGQIVLDDLKPGMISIPIGKPIANMRFYILDAQMQPVPVGVPGEIYLAGVGLARGYLNRPDLDKEKFVLNPFSYNLNDRLYRTGDRGRYLPDGNIEFLGRIDDQVKVRGFRIELGEIEARLAAHPSIKSAVVLVREDIPGSKRLIGYILPQDVVDPELSPKNTLQADHLREFLRSDLPEYMIPSAFVLIDHIPLTPNGKIDRRALPSPEQAGIDISTQYVPPRTAEEVELERIWTEVLSISPTTLRPTIGINDNFFELGGDSILAIQVISRANQAGIRITPRHLFEFPTIADLARVAVDAASRPEELGQSGYKPIQDSTGSKDLAAEINVLDEFGWNAEDVEGILGAIHALDDSEDENK